MAAIGRLVLLVNLKTNKVMFVVEANVLLESTQSTMRNKFENDIMSREK